MEGGSEEKKMKDINQNVIFNVVSPVTTTGRQEANDDDSRQPLKCKSPLSCPRLFAVVGKRLESKAS